MERIPAKKEAQHYYEMYQKETNKFRQLADVVFEMRYNREMRGLKSAESIIAY